MNPVTRKGESQLVIVCYYFFTVTCYNYAQNTDHPDSAQEAPIPPDVLDTSSSLLTMDEAMNKVCFFIPNYNFIC